MSLRNVFKIGYSNLSVAVQPIDANQEIWCASKKFGIHAACEIFNLYITNYWL